MEEINIAKLAKFESRIRKIAQALESHGDLAIHQAINQSYYMQKAEELKLLKEGLHDAQVRLESVKELVRSHYADLYTNWRRDVRWLNGHLLKTKQCSEETQSNGVPGK